MQGGGTETDSAAHPPQVQGQQRAPDAAAGARGVLVVVIVVTVVRRWVHGVVRQAGRPDDLELVRLLVDGHLHGRAVPGLRVLGPDVGQHDGHEEDGVDGARHDHHAHDLEEGAEEVGLGHEQHGHAHQGGHAPVEDGAGRVHQSVAGAVLAQRLVRHQVGGADVGREIHGEAHAHQDVDHGNPAETHTHTQPQHSSGCLID